MVWAFVHSVACRCCHSLIPFTFLYFSMGYCFHPGFRWNATMHEGLSDKSQIWCIYQKIWKQPLPHGRISYFCGINVHWSYSKFDISRTWNYFIFNRYMLCHSHYEVSATRVQLGYRGNGCLMVECFRDWSLCGLTFILNLCIAHQFFSTARYYELGLHTFLN